MSVFLLLSFYIPPSYQSLVNARLKFKRGVEGSVVSARRRLDVTEAPWLSGAARGSCWQKDGKIRYTSTEQLTTENDGFCSRFPPHRRIQQRHAFDLEEKVVCWERFIVLARGEEKKEVLLDHINGMDLSSICPRDNAKHTCVLLF